MVGNRKIEDCAGLLVNVMTILRIRRTPLGCCLAKERHVKNIGLVGVDESRLGFAQRWRNEVRLNCVRVDAVVDLGEIAADVPADGLTLGLLEPLELFDEVKLEFDRDPRGELQGDVQMGVGASVAPGLGLDASGARALNPLLGGEVKLLRPACFLIPSNSTGLKLGLLICSQRPRNSRVLRLRSQLRIRSSLASAFL